MKDLLLIIITLCSLCRRHCVALNHLNCSLSLLNVEMF